MTPKPSPTPTPVPWILSGISAYSDQCKDRGNLFSCNLSTGTHIPIEQNQINAAHIVRCVNSHQELLSALRDVEFYLDHQASDSQTRALRLTIQKGRKE